MIIGNKNKIKNSHIAGKNIKVENSTKERKIVWNFIVPIIVGVIGTLIATFIINKLNMK